MSESDFSGENHIAILGLGLMGGSLALALRGCCQEISGYDPDPPTLELARRMRLADRLTAEPAEALEGCDLMVLAAPVGAILDLLKRLPDLHPGAPVVMDLGSTKQVICQEMENLPERFEPIGGHPMCGKETAGLANAEATLFRQAPFALTLLPRTTARAQRLAEQLVRAVGAQPVWLEPETHDQWVAATSHMPYLLAAALSLATPGEAAALVGPGWRSSTRLAASSPAMMADVLNTNRENVLQAMGRLRGKMEILETILRTEPVNVLRKTLENAATARSFMMREQSPGGGR